MPASPFIFVSRRYHFEAAHSLPNVPDGHKCKNVHGHNYEFELTVTSEPGPDGFVIDFFNLDRMVEPILKVIDHQYLNDIPGLDNPTVEVIAPWIFNEVEDTLNSTLLRAAPKLIRVRVYETKDCWADAFAPEEIKS